MSKNDITFNVKVVNDAKAGLAALGIDLAKLAQNVNKVGERGGQASKLASDNANRHALAVKRLVETVNTGTAALGKMAVAQAKVNQAQATARAQTRTVQARARTAETRSTETEAAAAIRLRNQQALAEERLLAAVQRRQAAEARAAQTLATRQARDSIAVSRARIPLDRDTQLAANRVTRDTAATQVAQAQASTAQARARLAVEREQVQVERLRVRLAEERLRLAAMEAAAKGRDLQMAQRIAQAEARTQAAQIARQRQQVLLQNAQARSGARAGGLHVPTGILGRLGHAIMGPPGGGGPNVWPGLMGSAGPAAAALGRLGQAARGLGFAYVTTEVINLADQMRTLYARVGLVTDGTLQQGMAFRELTAVAQSTRSGLNEVVNVYYGLTRANATLGMTQREMISITKGISQSIAISGVNAQAASFGLMQLAQAFSSGQLRGDELNSVLEQLPALAQAIAKNVKLTTGEIGLAGPGALKTLAEQGKLSVGQVVEAIRKSLPEFEKQFRRLPVTVGQGLEVVKNGFMTMIATIDRATGATNSLGTMLTRFGTYLTSDDFARFSGQIAKSLADIASVIGTVVGPAFGFLKDNISAVTRELIALTAAWVALTAVAKAGAFVSFIAGLARTSGLLARMVMVVRSAALATTALSAAQVLAAGTANALGLSLGALGLNPWVLAVMAAVAAVGYFGAKMYLAKRQADTLATSIEGIRDQQKQLRDLTPEQIKNLDPNVVQSNYANATATKETLASQLLPKQQEYDEAAEKLRALRERIAELRKQAGDATSGYAFNRANDLERTAQAWEKNLAKMRGGLIATKRELVDAMEVAQGWKAVMDGALDNIPGNTRAFGLNSEEQNRLKGFLEGGSPAMKRAMDLAQFTELDEKTTVTNRRDLVQPMLKAGLFKDLGPIAGPDENGMYPDEVVNHVYNRVRDLARVDLQDSAFAKSLRDINTELRLLYAENAAGGPLPVVRKVLEARKAIAAEMGKTTDPFSDAVTAQLGDLPGKYAAEQRLKEERALNTAAREKLALAQEENRWIGLRGADLLREKAISDVIKKLRAENAALTEKDAEAYRRKLLPAMQEAADATMLNLGKRKLTGELDDMERAITMLQKKLKVDPQLWDSVDPLLKLQEGVANTMELPLAFVIENWTMLLARMGMTAGEVAKALGDLATADAAANLRKSISDATLALEDQHRVRMLVGDELEREKFVLEEINKLIASGTAKDRATARTMVEDEIRAGGLDAAFEAKRRSERDPVIGPIEGARRAYRDFINEAANLNEQFAEITKNALNGIGDSFAELVTTGKSNFRELTAGILRDVARMIVRMLVLQAIMATMGWVSSRGAPVGGTGGGMGVTPSAGGPMYAAKGAVVAHGQKVKAYATGGVLVRGRQVQAYAKGGVFERSREVIEHSRSVVKHAVGGLVTKPTFFPMANGKTGLMGEAGPEAIMPLRRLSNGRLGVEATGNTSVSNVFAPAISVSVDGSKSGTPEQNADLANKIGDQLNKMIDAKMAEFAQRQMRPGGLLAR